MDNRILKLAGNIVDYSLGLKKGETVVLNVRGMTNFELGKSVKDYCEMNGINVIDEFLTTEQYVNRWKGIDNARLKEIIDREKDWYQTASATCIIREECPYQFNAEENKMIAAYNNEITKNFRLKRPWVLTCLPTEEKARESGKDYHELMEMYLNSCSINYDKLSVAMDNLIAYMKNAEKVKILAPNTNLEFKICGLPQVKCIGKRNLPDGELYTAPVKDSVNGYITYNVPSIQNGVTHENIYLEFKNGKIVNATSNHTKELNEVFDIDEGARYVGEFSFGLNPLITSPCNSILYDEKINGSIHFTPGSCYERCNNGNKSALHWDLIQIQTKEYGGGQIWFDDVLIRENGLFVPEDLKVLNPEQLLKALQDDQSTL